jgi:hypothetical protein
MKISGFIRTCIRRIPPAAACRHPACEQSNRRTKIDVATAERDAGEKLMFTHIYAPTTLPVRMIDSLRKGAIHDREQDGARFSWSRNFTLVMPSLVGYSAVYEKNYQSIGNTTYVVYCRAYLHQVSFILSKPLRYLTDRSRFVNQPPECEVSDAISGANQSRSLTNSIGEIHLIDIDGSRLKASHLHIRKR